MSAIEIADGIFWVGAVDWNRRDFHGYSTKQGTTYNAYLIMDEKITLLDTVRKEFTEELINNISQIVDPKKIYYVISNHTEMDHSGGLPRVMHTTLVACQGSCTELVRIIPSIAPRWAIEIFPVIFPRIGITNLSKRVEY